MFRTLSSVCSLLLVVALVQPLGAPLAHAQDDVAARLSALEASVDKLAKRLAAGEARMEEQITSSMTRLRGTLETMSRRGTVLLPHLMKIPRRLGDSTAMQIGSSPSLGPAAALVEVIEVGEFQCPFCMKHAGFLQELVEEYPKRVRVGFKHHPLRRHKMSRKAAAASWAAQQQGKFWEMHDALFASKGKLSGDAIGSHAKAIGLDMKKFWADTKSPEAQAAIRSDRQAAKAAGVNGTPTYFVNGLFVGNNPADVRRTIESVLKGEPVGSEVTPLDLTGN